MTLFQYFVIVAVIVGAYALTDRICDCIEHCSKINANAWAMRESAVDHPNLITLEEPTSD